MRLWARQDAIDNVDYALQKGIEQLDFYDDYFATKFPLPKMGKFLIMSYSVLYTHLTLLY